MIFTVFQDYVIQFESSQSLDGTKMGYTCTCNREKYRTRTWLISHMTHMWRGRLKPNSNELLNYSALYHSATEDNLYDLIWFRSLYDYIISGQIGTSSWSCDTLFTVLTSIMFQCISSKIVKSVFPDGFWTLECAANSMLLQFQATVLELVILFSLSLVARPQKSFDPFAHYSSDQVYEVIHLKSY